jgi:hypothetical protein
MLFGPTNKLILFIDHYRTPCRLPQSASKAWVVVGGWVVVVERKSSDQLWHSFSLALAKPNNIFEMSIWE